MPLPLPGNTISFLDLATEFLDTPNYEIIDYYRGGLLVKNVKENSNIPIVLLANTDNWALSNTVGYNDYTSTTAYSNTNQLYTSGSNVEKQNQIELGNFYGARRTGSVRPLLYYTLSVEGSTDATPPISGIPSYGGVDLGDGKTFYKIDLYSLASSNASFINGNTDIVLVNYGKIVSNQWGPPNGPIPKGGPGLYYSVPQTANDAALVIPGQFLPGTKISIINRGQIHGGGGGGGLGYSPTFPTDISETYGWPGTHGIWIDPVFATGPYSNSRITIFNQGEIAGGGGGGPGGGGGIYFYPSPPKDSPPKGAPPGALFTWYGGDGGGGAGTGLGYAPAFLSAVYSGKIGNLAITVPAPDDSGGPRTGVTGGTGGNLGIGGGGGSRPSSQPGYSILGANGVVFIGTPGNIYGPTVP